MQPISSTSIVQIIFFKKSAPFCHISKDNPEKILCQPEYRSSAPVFFFQHLGHFFIGSLPFIVITNHPRSGVNQRKLHRVQHRDDLLQTGLFFSTDFLNSHGISRFCVL
jgi:hypothetical protein